MFLLFKKSDSVRIKLNKILWKIKHRDTKNIFSKKKLDANFIRHPDKIMLDYWIFSSHIPKWISDKLNPPSYHLGGF